MALTLADLRGDQARRRKEAAARVCFLALAGLSVLISALIVLSLVFEAWAFITSVDLGALWESGWFPRRGTYDVRTIVVGSVLVTLIAMAVATPLGLGVAVYLSEYAPAGFRRVLKPIIEILAGIPSVVFAYFALNYIQPDLVQRIFSGATGRGSILTAGVGVGILVVPIVASISEDALRAVPGALREASYGIGAKRSATSLRVVMPAAVSGLVAAFIIGASRAIGETLVVTLAGGAASTASFTTDPLDGTLTMTAAMASLATGSDRVVGAANTFQSLFFVGLLLFAFTLSLNLLADRFVRRVRQRY